MTDHSTQHPAAATPSDAIPFDRRFYTIFVRADRPSRVSDARIRFQDQSRIIASTGYADAGRRQYLAAINLIGPSGAERLSTGDKAMGRDGRVHVEFASARPADEVDYLTNLVRRRYGAEVQVEIQPGTSDPEKLRLLQTVRGMLSEEGSS